MNEVLREERAAPEPTKPNGESGLSRRGFLGALGLGAGTLAVVGAAGLTWRATSGGVFATGTGPAYDAWGSVNLTCGDLESLVGAAVLAANAHNSQPWQFAFDDHGIDVFTDPDRSIGAIDPLRREMDISLGCAIENLVVAAPTNGMHASVTWLPNAAEPTHVARVDVSDARSHASPLFSAIRHRRTHRGAYDTSRPVAPDSLASLSALVDAPDVELVWFTTDDAKKRFSDLTVRATEAIIADEQQSADDFAWYRMSWSEMQRLKDGITIDPSGQSPLIRAVSKIMPLSRETNNAGWLRATRDSQLPTAAAFGALVVRDPLDRRQRLDTGRIWQRLHLTATAEGLGVQPLCQVPERIDRERSSGLDPEITREMASMLSSGQHPIMTFRIGYPTQDPPPSPRRPASDVIRPMDGGGRS